MAGKTVQRDSRLTKQGGLKLLQFSHGEEFGGANRIASQLHRIFVRRGIDSRLVIGGPSVGGLKGIERMPNENYRIKKFLPRILNAIRPDMYSEGFSRATLASKLVLAAAEPVRYAHRRLGHDDVYQPASREILNELWPETQAILCHNLHGGYFDVRELSRLSSVVPTIVVLHDLWLLTGGCGYSLECERWKIGCGHCPHPELVSTHRRYGTSYNWKKRSRIYSRSRLHIIAPSQWALDCARQSMLVPGLVEARRIPNGIDTDVFRPGNKMTARDALNLPQDAVVLLTAAAYMNTNQVKNVGMIRAALSGVSSALRRRNVVLVALGAEGEDVRNGNLEIRHTGYLKSEEIIAMYYQAADIYLHSAAAEVWGLAVTQALASAVPVISTDVGGIRDQVLSMNEARSSTVAGVTCPNGILVGLDDVAGMKTAVIELIENTSLRKMLSTNALEAGRQFSISRQVDAYLKWLGDLVTPSTSATTIVN